MLSFFVSRCYLPAQRWCSAPLGRPQFHDCEAIKRAIACRNLVFQPSRCGLNLQNACKGPSSPSPVLGLKRGCALRRNSDAASRFQKTPETQFVIAAIILAAITNPLSQASAHIRLQKRIKWRGSGQNTRRRRNRRGLRCWRRRRRCAGAVRWLIRSIIWRIWYRGRRVIGIRRERLTRRGVAALTWLVNIAAIDGFHLDIVEFS